MRPSRFFLPLLVALGMAAAPAASFAQVSVGVSITVAPPALPVYVQPPIPGPGFLWTPGYWAYGPAGYYWVPGTWVRPPAVGLLWTPGYWGWRGGVYAWHAGYWGPHVGFYGGVNYGFGYVGVGYAGGYWSHGVFAYNRAVNNIRNTTVITNTYNKTVVNNINVTRVSYNGGAGGTAARPTAQEQAAEHEHHMAPTALQAQHEHAASANHALRASVNHGRPGIAATREPGVFHGAGVAAAKAPHHPPANGARVASRQPHPQAHPAAHPPHNAQPHERPERHDEHHEEHHE